MNNLKKRSWILVIIMGFITGLLIKKVYEEKMPISPEKALQLAKESFASVGEISGSWIENERKPYIKNEIEYSVYMAGITRRMGVEVTCYQCIIDSATGIILEVNEL